MPEPRVLFEDTLTVVSEVLGHLLGSEGDVWGWYRKVTRTDGDGNPKYTTFTLVEASLSPNGATTSWSFGQVEIPEARFRIIEAKLGALEDHLSSITGRNMKSDPPVYGGATSFQVSQNAWGLAGSGAPELVDHLIVLQILFYTSKISNSDYDARSDLDYPGVREAMDHVDMNAGTYIAMRAGIEARFRRAVDKLPR